LTAGGFASGDRDGNVDGAVAQAASKNNINAAGKRIFMNPPPQ
jgi:hypothetical protein